jgi:hypothetical protein
MQMEALEAAREMLPLITRHRGDTESARRIAQPVVHALRKARLCRLAIPRELHGLELPTPDLLDVYEMMWLEDTGRIALGLKSVNPLYLV